MAVDLKVKSCLGEVLHQSALLIADDDRKVDQTGIDRDGGCGGNWVQELAIPVSAGRRAAMQEKGFQAG